MSESSSMPSSVFSMATQQARETALTLLEAFLTAPAVPRGRHLTDFVRHAGGRGAHLELGVGRGTSLAILAASVGDGVRFHGFDSFQGLPADWQKNPGSIEYPKGSFACPPPAHIAGTHLVVGRVEETLPRWLHDNPGPVGFVHFDLDLYEPTKACLVTLTSRLQRGAVLVFDELCNWTNPAAYQRFREHEWRALTEWITETGTKVRVVGRDTTEAGAVEIIA